MHGAEHRQRGAHRERQEQLDCHAPQHRGDKLVLKLPVERAGAVLRLQPLRLRTLKGERGKRTEHGRGVAHIKDDDVPRPIEDLHGRDRLHLPQATIQKIGLLQRQLRRAKMHANSSA